MSATIKYKGNTIATASNNTKTLLTAGKYMEANVVVTDNGGGGSPTLQTKSVTYTPSASQQTDTITPDDGYDGLDEVDVTVNAVSAGSATTPATTITANPTISISGNSVSASVSKTQSITPTVSSGYVTSGTAGTVTVSGSGSATIQSASNPYIDSASIDSSGNLTVDIEVDTDGYVASTTYSSTMNNAVSVQGAQTIYPSTSDQTIASSKYLTGAQTIKGVTYTNLTAGNIKKDVVVKIGDSADDDRIVSVTGTYEGGGGISFEDCVKQTVSGAVNLSFSPSLTRERDSYGYMFQKCFGITSVSITGLDVVPNYFCDMGDNSTNASQLATVSYPDATFLGNGAFRGCKSLTAAYLPNITRTYENYAQYGQNAFKNCINLTTVNIGAPNRVSDSMFRQCTSLQEIQFGANTGAVWANAFYNCYALQAVVLRKSDAIATLNNVSAFTNTPFRGYGGSYSGHIFVPQALISSYESASNWSTLVASYPGLFASIEGSIYE